MTHEEMIGLMDDGILSPYTLAVDLIKYLSSTQIEDFARMYDLENDEED